MKLETKYEVQTLNVKRLEESNTGWVGFEVRFAPNRHIFVQKGQIDMQAAILCSQDADNLVLALTLAVRTVREMETGIKITALDNPNC